MKSNWFTKHLVDPTRRAIRSKQPSGSRLLSRPRLELLEDRSLLSVSLVKDINPGNPSSKPRELANLNGLLLFAATDGTAGEFQLWETDGTDSGTTLVKSFPITNGLNSHPDLLTVFNNEVYFAINTGVSSSRKRCTDENQ